MSKETDITAVIERAGRVWDTECREAYDLGVFDTSRDAWIAAAILAMPVPTETPAPKIKPRVSRIIVNELLYRLNSIAEDENPGECGLPTYALDIMEQMADTVACTLDLEIINDHD